VETGTGAARREGGNTKRIERLESASGADDKPRKDRGFASLKALKKNSLPPRLNKGGRGVRASKTQNFKQEAPGEIMHTDGQVIRSWFGKRWSGSLTWVEGGKAGWVLR